MKIGITCAGCDDLFSNGCRQNLILYYDLFKLMEYNVYFISYKEIKYCDYNFINEKNIEDTVFDFVFIIGYTLSNNTIKILKNNNTKIIYVMLGKIYNLDVESIIYKKNLNNIVYNYDEVWISPHFENEIEYYKLRYKTDNVYVAPYFWSPKFTKNSFEHKISNKIDQINIAIMEPNLNWAKNCLIPICIAEKANKHVDSCYVWCGSRLVKNKFLVNLVSGFELSKEKKISFEHRYSLYKILDHCNCIVTNQINLDLNYIYFEALYYGIPLIHNSERIKYYGYYYPGNNIKIGADQIEKILKEHDKETYIQKNKPIIYKYSIYNKEYHKWIRDRLHL